MPVKNPYRDMAETTISEALKLRLPDQLEPFKAWNSLKRLSDAGKDRPADHYCRCCNHNGVTVIPKMCTGKMVGFCNRVVCSERREHFHCKCIVCGDRFLMATKRETP